MKQAIGWALIAIFGAVLIAASPAAMAAASNTHSDVHPDPHSEPHPDPHPDPMTVAIGPSRLTGPEEAVAAQPRALVVRVVCGTPAQGQVIIALYDTEDTFLEEPVARVTAPVRDNGTAQVVFDDLPPGDYAVSVVHDEDMSGNLNRNFFGVPTEKIGFSNGARPMFSRPKFEEARVVVGDDGLVIDIMLAEV